jgi:hypothetical protein
MELEQLALEAEKQDYEQFFEPYDLDLFVMETTENFLDLLAE